MTVKEQMQQELSLRCSAQMSAVKNQNGVVVGGALWNSLEGNELKKIPAASGRLAPPKLDRRSTSLMRTIEEEEKEESLFQARCMKRLEKSVTSDSSNELVQEEQKICSANSTPELSIDDSSSSCNSVEDEAQQVVETEKDSQLAQAAEQVSAAASLAAQQSFTEELLKLVGSSMTGVANARNAIRTGSPFEGANAPGISLPNYLKRLVRYLEAWKPSTGAPGEISIGLRCVVLAVTYVDRLCERCPDFSVTIFNMHRVLLSAFLAAVKFTEDTPFPNSFWARVGGVPVADLNAMESKFLSMVAFDLHVRSEQFDATIQRFSKFIGPM